MSKIGRRIAKQDCVYWAPKGVDDFGNTQYEAPVDMKCRWEDVNELFTDNAGAERMSRSKVYTTEDVVADGAMCLGTLDEMEQINRPFDNEGTYEIQRFDK